MEASISLWEGPPGVHLTLKYKAPTSTSPAYYVLIDKSQTNYYFDFNTGRLEAIIDDNGNITDLAYNTDGTLTNMSDPSGRIVYFKYQNGKLVTITGNEIQTVRYAYNTAGDLVTVTKENSAGTILEKVSYAYDGYHNVVSVEDPKLNKTSVSYFGSDRVYQISYSVTNANGVLETHYTTYTYTQNVDTFVTEVKDPKDVITRYSTNANGNLVKIEEDYNPSTKSSRRNIFF
jgi:YD repeat-containing protein